LLIHNTSENALVVQSTECDQILRIDNHTKSVVFTHNIVANATQEVVGSLTGPSGLNDPSKTYLNTAFLGEEPTSHHLGSSFRIRIDKENGLLHIEQKILNEVPPDTQPDIVQQELNQNGNMSELGTWSSLLVMSGPGSSSSAFYPTSHNSETI